MQYTGRKLKLYIKGGKGTIGQGGVNFSENYYFIKKGD